MPQQNNTPVTNHFTGGLITEATALNFPENACFETQNCIFDLIGTVSRRRGIDFELGHFVEAQTSNFAQANNSPATVSTYLWRNVRGDGNRNLIVAQVGNAIVFYHLVDGATVSPGYITIGIFQLTLYQVPGAPSPSNFECQFSSGNGYLFITNPSCSPLAVSNFTGDTFVVNPITINIRDFDGVNDTYRISDRVGWAAYIAQNPPLHLYNLLNQGWTDGAHGDNIQSQLITLFSTLQGTIPNFVAPSNADVWQTFKDASGTFAPTAKMLTNINVGATQAPQGHVVFNAFNQDRNAWASQQGNPVTGLPTISTTQRPTVVAFYAGRVFYGGVNDPNYIGTIYFSQIIDQTASADVVAQFGNCYQQNDPTSDTLFDLLPTDGGVIKIADCGTIYKLFVIQNGLLVFASNGIWLISGNQGLGFTATDYSINKISAIRCTSGTSFVDVLGLPYFWAQEGIYRITPGKDNIPYGHGGLIVESLTDHTIRTFFQDIPQANRSFARGAYNAGDFTIQWLFQQSATLTSPYLYDSILVFNTLTGAFYPWTISTTPNSQCFIQGITCIDKGLVIDLFGNSTSDYLFKYYASELDTHGNRFLSWAEQQSNQYSDWNSPKFFSDGTITYTSDFTTGYSLAGQAWRKFQTGYVYIYSNNFENTYYTIQGLWNFSNTVSSGKWSGLQVVNNNNKQYNILYKRHRIRGIGNALQIKVSSVFNLPFFIIGWALWEQINQGP